MSYLAVIRSLEKLVVQRLYHRRASSGTCAAFAVFDERIFSEKRWGCSRRLAAAGVRTKKRRFEVSMSKHGRVHFLHVCVYSSDARALGCPNTVEYTFCARVCTCALSAHVCVHVHMCARISYGCL
jgi:hypothetical protein